MDICMQPGLNQYSLVQINARFMHISDSNSAGLTQTSKGQQAVSRRRKSWGHLGNCVPGSATGFLFVEVEFSSSFLVAIASSTLAPSTLARCALNLKALLARWISYLVRTSLEAR